MYINKAIIYGNLTRDPELKSLPSGAQVCEFGVATNRVWKDKNGAKQESTDYHNVVIFGRQAEVVKQYLYKGSGIFVEGRIQTRSWDAADGTKRYRTEIVADNMIMLDRAKGSSNYSRASEQPEPKNDFSQAEPKANNSAQEEEINVEDIPF